MKTTTLLVIEGRHAEVPSFAADLQKKGFDVHIAQNGSHAVTQLKSVSPSLVVINAASLRSTGLRICQSIREKDSKLPIILILENDVEVDKDAADAVLYLPFTAQKLVNRIKQTEDAGIHEVAHFEGSREPHGHLVCDLLNQRECIDDQGFALERSHRDNSSAHTGRP